MLVPRVFVKNLRLTQRLIDDFLANAFGAMMNARFVISIAYFGLNPNYALEITNFGLKNGNYKTV